jgi:hypothetical protein
MLGRSWVAVLGGAFVWLLTGSAAAQGTGDVERMITNLRTGGDFRVRTQAALALGASRSPRAAEALCGGLADANTTVRAAAAAALGKLQMGGADCLERRLASEPNQSVKGAIQTALDRVRGGAEPVFSPSTKYYIAIGKTADKSGRTGDGIDRMVRAAMASIAADLGAVLAPQNETQEDAKRRLQGKKGVRAFYLAPRLAPFEYTGEALKVRLEIAIFSYPEKNMLGNFTKMLTQQGTSGKDPSSEDELVKMVGERAMEQFAKLAPGIH